MKYKVMPVVDVDELQKALELQFGPEVMGNEDILTDILGEYDNYSYKRYYFSQNEVYEGHFWQNEEHIRIRNCVNAILQDMFPEHEEVLVDVSR